MFLNAQAHFLLNQCIALAVHDLVTANVSSPVYIKWPNDIYIGDGKTAGILIQTSVSGSRFQHCIAGIGINVNQLEFPLHLPNPVSLAQVEDRTFDLEALRAELFLHLESRYALLRTGHHERIRHDYLDRLYRKDFICEFKRPDGSIFEGAIAGVAEHGRLRIRHANGQEEQFEVKEVSFAP